MKNYFLLISLLFSLFGFSQYTAIPDSNFENALISYDDIPNDGQVPTANINTITSLNINLKNISNLTGIQDFISLITLECNYNNLTSLDLTSNNNLTTINCHHNNLSSLNLTNLSSTIINLRTNNNPNLKCVKIDDYLQFFTGINILTLDSWTNISENCGEMIPDDNFETYLETHDANGNSVPLGDPTSMGNGIMLDGIVPTASIANVITLNIPNLGIYNIIGIEYFANLETLNCSSNLISIIDITQNTALRVFSCAYNIIWSSVDVSSNINLFHLNVRDNKIDFIDITQNTALTFFNASNNDIPSFNVTQNNLLTFLSVDNNFLTDIDVTQNLDLVTFTCDFNYITSLDFSLHSSLEQLSAINNELTDLNVKNGNNINFSIYWSTDNPDLTCIIVDDSTWSDTNWSSFKDTTSAFVNSQVACNALAIDDNLLDNLSIYPNPAKNNIQIKTDNVSEYQIVSSNGQLIQKGRFQEGLNALDSSTFSNGIYFIKINSDFNQTVLKFIIEK